MYAYTHSRLLTPNEVKTCSDAYVNKIGADFFTNKDVATALAISPYAIRLIEYLPESDDDTHGVCIINFDERFGAHANFYDDICKILITNDIESKFDPKQHRVHIYKDGMEDFVDLVNLRAVLGRPHWKQSAPIGRIDFSQPAKEVPLQPSFTLAELGEILSISPLFIRKVITYHPDDPNEDMAYRIIFKPSFYQHKAHFERFHDFFKKEGVAVHVNREGNCLDIMKENHFRFKNLISRRRAKKQRAAAFHRMGI